MEGDIHDCLQGECQQVEEAEGGVHDFSHVRYSLVDSGLVLSDCGRSHPGSGRFQIGW